jgi:hypothetical protein
MTPVPEAVQTLFQTRDLPEKLGPMTVKELRQGLRRGMFVYPFIGIHLLAVVAMAVEFQMAELEPFTKHTGMLNLLLFMPGSDWFSGPFWGVTGAVCLVLMPLGGLALMGQELEEGNHELLLMTPLSRWKVIRGKFFAMWGLCLLTFVSLLPYMIVRYLIGGIDTWRSISMSLTVIVFSAMMAAGAIGASSFTGIAGRIAVLGLFIGSMLASLATVASASAAMLGNVGWAPNGLVYHFNSLSAAFCYIVFGLALARSRIRLVVHHYEVKPSWMIIGLLFFTPFVAAMATAMTVGFAGGVGLVGMGLVGLFADASPKAPKWVEAPAPNIPQPPALPGVPAGPPQVPGTSAPDGESPSREGDGPQGSPRGQD